MIETIKREYLEQDYQHPKYIFHGSKRLLETIDTNQAHDNNNTLKNMQNAVYGSSVFLGAIPYAIKGNGKYNCSIGYNVDDLTMKITYGVIPEDDYGYVYVCDAKDFIQCENTCQYVCYKSIEPLETIKIYYRDFKDCFEYVDEEVNKKTK